MRVFYYTTNYYECVRYFLHADYFYQHSLGPLAVKFSVENLFPWPEIQFAAGYRYDSFPAHDCALKMAMCVIFAAKIMKIISGLRG
jgi:hypothetical protein